MKTLLHDSLHKWLITVLTSLWALFLLRFGTGAALHMIPIIGVLLLWTVVMAAVDRLMRPLAVAVLLFGVVTATFAAFRGAALIEYTAMLYTGGLTEASLAGDTVVLLEALIFSWAAMYVFAGFWPRALLSLGWTAWWIWAALEELAVPKIALAAMVPVIFFTLVEAIHRLWGKKSGFHTLAPVLMALFTALAALMMLLPTPDLPHGYPILNAIWDKVEEIYDDTVTKLFYREGGDGEFRLDFAGYSEDADTGDGVGSGHGVAGDLLAKAQHNLDNSIYLVGNSWNTFNGRSWINSIHGDERELLDWNTDTAERIYALWRHQKSQDDPIGVTNYFRSTSVYLMYQNMRTRTLFTVPNATRITTDTKRFPWDSEPGKVLFDYLQTRDTYYRVYYLAQNQRYLPDVIRGAEGYTYDREKDLIWRVIFGDYRGEFMLTLDIFETAQHIEPALARRQELIYENYMSLPEDISDRVKALALEITQNCGSDYEKLMAIADYLQSSYTYTTTPAPVPEGVPFLDYVLFEAREGYCTWYATAATLLARCAGVPARYVQGYCQSLEAGVLTAVEGSSSHAWCEGYVPGFGWVTVEATPGYTNTGASWGDMADQEELPEEELPDEEPEGADVEEPSGESDPTVIKMIGAAAFAVCLAALSVVMWQLERIRRRYRSASWSGKAVLDLEAFLKAPARREYRRSNSETLRQYFARLRWSLRLDPVLMDRMTILYEEVLFAQRELTEEEWKECRSFLAMLKKIRRKQVWTN